MNLPNILTLIRIALVPFFIIFFHLGQAGAQLYSILALVVFAVASLTDAVDGLIARKKNLVTNFGALMDPLADKILTTAAFVLFVEVNIIPAWAVVVILAREFAITGLRGVAAAEGVVLPAGFAGKLKTIFQMIVICVILLTLIVANYGLGMIGLGLFWVTLVITVYSGVEYLVKGRKLLNFK